MSPRPQTDRAKQPAWAICGACGWSWIFGYTPIRLEAFIVLGKRATCPRCAERKRLFVCDHEPTKQEAAEMVKRITTQLAAGAARNVRQRGKRSATGRRQ